MIQKGRARYQNGASGEGTLLPLSVQQARWWHFDEVYGTARCQTSIQLEFRGRLDHQAMRSAFERLISRHEILRARFQANDGLPRQYVVSGAEALSFTEHNLDGHWRAEQLCRLDAQEPLSLAGGPLIRGSLMRLPDHVHLLLLTLHPIICDGASLNRLTHELLLLYKAGVTGDEEQMPRVVVQFSDYIPADSRQHVEKGLPEDLGRWGELLSGSHDPWLISRVDRYSAAGFSPNEHVSVQLSLELTAKLREMARDQGLKLHTVLTGAWAGLLLRWFEQATVVLGVEASDRRRQVKVPLVGPIDDLVPLRIGTGESTTMVALLQEIGRAAKRCSPADLGSWEGVFELNRAGNRAQPVIPVAIGVNSQPWRDELTSIDMPGLTIERVSTERRWPCAAISVSLEERGPAPTTTLHYFPGSMERATAERVADTWLSLLGTMVSNCRAPVRHVSPSVGSERDPVAIAVNGTAPNVSLHGAVHELFEEQVRKTPDSIAVEHEGRSLTYRQLNARANQLARFLVNQGVRPDQVVGICIDRSLEMVIGLLGILKAGGAYLPLDPNYPRGRLEQMLDDARPQVLITETELVGVLPSGLGKVIEIDRELGQLAGFVDDNLDSGELGLNSERLVYVIYTSGSTGKPKGIAMPHRAMVNLIEWHRGVFGSSEGQRVLQFAALSFDVAFQEFFSTLCTGGTLILLDEWVRRDAKALAEFLVDHCIHRLFIPPVMLHSVIEHCEVAGIVPASLRDVVTAGEQLRVNAATRAFFTKVTGCRLHNHYGPTESHVVTAFTLTGNPADWQTLPPIGQPIANTQIHLLDEQRQPVSSGKTGEIYIGGANVARGYLHQPQLTEQRFVPNPYSADPSTRLYRTGDLGRWRTDGTLEYLGRNDDQVKVRGFRVELGEIEAQVGRHEGVSEVAVVARDDSPGEKRLVAYVTLKEEVPGVVDELREHLRGALPEYMLPNAIVVMEKLPLTPSGKVDRRALPAPDASAYSVTEYEAPRGQLEERAAGIWQELLRIERIGRGDDFFELGGHSLLVVQMMARLRSMGLSCDATSVYLHPVLAEFAQTIVENRNDSTVVPPNGIPPDCEWITPRMLPLVDLEPEHIRQIAGAVPGGAKNIQDIYPLAPLQEGLLFHHKYGKHRGDTYVLPTLLSVSSREKVSELIRGFQCLIQRHDILRTAVLWEQLPGPVQVVYRKATLPIEEVSLDPRRDSLEQLRELMRPERQTMDMRQAPLVRLSVITAPLDQRCYVLLKLHHFAGDHESIETMFEELIAHVEGRARALPEPVAYRIHVAQARSLAAASESEAEEFFRSKLADVDEPTAPFGLKDVYVDPRRIVQQFRAVDPQLARRIRAEARRFGVSPATLFHAAWAMVICRASGRDDVVFGTVLLGRFQGIAGAQRALGMFINTLPLRLKLSGVSAEDLVRQTHQELTGLLSHEQSSLAVAQRCAGTAGSSPLFSALMNYRYVRVPIETGQPELTSGIKVVASFEWTNYPVVLSVDDKGDEFVLTAQTDLSVEPETLMNHVLTALESLITALGGTPRVSVLDLSVMPESELKQILSSFSASAADFSSEKMIHELFEAQARVRPSAVAVTSATHSLTYDELNRRANQLAWCLRRHGVRQDQLVGIYMDRGLDMIVGLLAILKAGAGYLPLDPAYPSERIAFLVNDASPTVVVTQERFKARLPNATAIVLAVDTEWPSIAKSPTGNLALRPSGLSSESLAYVIYTSGSTGKPKGVMVEHRNVTRLFAATDSWFGFTDRDVWTVFHSVAFDFSVWELWGALINGGRAVVVPYSVARSPQEFYRLLSREGVTVLNQTPSAFVQLTDAQAKCSDLGHSLRLIIFGGEALEFKNLAPWVARNGAENPRLVNMYGITETTVHVTYRPISRQDIESEAGSIVGRPIPDLRIYILDRRGQPAPVGAAGEIHVGGAGVARGYLNRPELTEERFVRDPFSADPAARMYKTGDLGRWRTDGSIQYLGRNDGQVKVRGFRIELREIEAQLASHPAVKDAVVLAREDVPGETRLVAYVVGDRQRLRDGDSQVSPAKLRDATVTEWKELYEETYRKGTIKSQPSFVGWNSSYTGQPIPEPEMQEWRACTIERISSLRPQNVLEVGCGVGLLLEHLAPQCEKYVGTDFSDMALSQVHGWVDGNARYRRVTLLQRSALELQDFPDGSFDTVILNSVVQYFPDLEYLSKVLEEAVRLVRPPGRIFVGDVRHLGLLSTFHSAVQLSKAPATLSTGALRTRIARALAQEKELVIDPGFFESLPARTAQICAVDVQLKHGKADNELTTYRYDVTLRIGEETPTCPASDCVEWKAGVDSLSSLKASLEERTWTAARICGIPNGRLSRDSAARRLIEASDGRTSAGTLRTTLREANSRGPDPAEVCALAESHGYVANLQWSERGSPEEFDVMFVDPARAHLMPRTMRESKRIPTALDTLSNDPLDSAFRQDLVPKLRELMRERLPDYMVPSAYVVLKELPITVNGKLDRRALPAPQGRPEEIGEYVPPRSDLERLVAGIWAQVLRVDQVGLYDNFLELGGHSLLATRVTNQISQALELELPVRDIFENPTVDSLARSILKGIANDVLAEAS